MANRVSNDQLEELLNFLSEHPALAKGVGLGIRSKEAVEKQWNDLANRLNSYGSGSSKSGERWKKYWADIKHKSKTRLVKRKQDALGTGGGPSSQEDLSEVDKKILSIIGPQAVFGDSEHRVPAFNVESHPTHPSHNIDELEHEDIQEATPTSNEIEILVVNSPSTRGHTSRVFTENTSTVEQNTTNQQIRQVPEPEPQQELASPVSRRSVNRPRPRHRQPSLSSTSQSRIDPQWVMDLERRRVEAENKLADAALIMAESTRAHVEIAHGQAELTGVLIDLIKRQSDDIRALLETTRKQTRQTESSFII